MSTSESHPGVPEFDLADRLRKALRTSGVGALEMADHLGVARNTVSNWINGHGHKPPRDAYLRLWALRTGVPFKWLKYGEVTPEDDERSSTTGRYPRVPVTLRTPPAMKTPPTQIAAAAA